VHDAWQNLPERVASEFPTPEHLRKHALIAAGFCDKQSVVFDSQEDAQRAAAFMRPVDPYAVVSVSGTVVTRYTAQSQSIRAMGKKIFQESKDAVLEIIAGMVGVERAALVREAGRAA